MLRSEYEHRRGGKIRLEFLLTAINIETSKDAAKSTSENVLLKTAGRSRPRRSRSNFCGDDLSCSGRVAVSFFSASLLSKRLGRPEAVG